jgi:putative oxidoreductase
MQGFYQFIIKLGNLLQSPLLLAIRLYWGVQFAISGYGKFLNIQQVIGFFDGLNIPFPTISAYLAAGTELVGGICLVIGLASRLVSIPLIFTMLVAYIAADPESIRSIFSDPQHFVSRTPFLFLYTSLIILAFGPGIFSVDAFLKRFFKK